MGVEENLMGLATIRIFPESEINVVVVGGEANGYWRIMAAKYRKTVSIDAWR